VTLDQVLRLKAAESESRILYAGGPGSGPHPGSKWASKEEHDRYLHQDCPVYALAMHQLTGNPIYSLKVGEGATTEDANVGDPVHYVVYDAKNRNYVDVRSEVRRHRRGQRQSR
jgi:hypothetical protein